MKKSGYVRLAAGLVISCGHAMAGTVMPWNTGLTQIGSNITGPTALGLVTLGAAGSIAPMIFQGEIPHYVHRMAHIVLAGGTLLGIGYLVSLIGIGGALV